MEGQYSINFLEVQAILLRKNDNVLKQDRFYIELSQTDIW